MHRGLKLFGDGQREDEAVLVVEGADRFGLGLDAIRIGPEFVIGVLRELAKVEVAGVIADVGFDSIRAGVFEIHHGAGQNCVRFVDDLPVDRSLFWDGGALRRETGCSDGEQKCGWDGDRT